MKTFLPKKPLILGFVLAPLDGFINDTAKFVEIHFLADALCADIVLQINLVVVQCVVSDDDIATEQPSLHMEFKGCHALVFRCHKISMPHERMTFNGVMPTSWSLMVFAICNTKSLSIFNSIMISQNFLLPR